jgi:hypothetical protein
MYSPIPIKRSTKYGNNYWISYSPKMKRNIRLFSDLEYDHWILIETDPKITSFCEQPLRIRQPIGIEFVESIFDMWIIDAQGVETFIEVKYARELDLQSPKSARSIRQTDAQKKWCQENGYQYKVALDREIRSNPILLSNLKQIVSHMKNRKQLVETDRFKITQQLKRGKTNLIQLVRTTPQIEESRLRDAVFGLIYEGSVKANLDKVLIGHMTEVWIDEE